jgi:hypothetical protein
MVPPFADGSMNPRNALANARSGQAYEKTLLQFADRCVCDCAYGCAIGQRVLLAELAGKRYDNHSNDIERVDCSPDNAIDPVDTDRNSARR